MTKAFLTTVVALMMVFAVNSYATTRGHNFTKSDCYQCHLSPDTNTAQLRRVTITEMCTPCHRMIVKTSSHPVDARRVNADVPSGMPLDDGRITCVTCHDVHADGAIAPDRKSYYLRVQASDTEAFCALCHEQGIRDVMSGHTRGVGIAHPGVYYRRIDSGRNIDALSLKCLSCHDGTLADGVVHEGGGEHPIGVDYRAASLKNNKLVPLRHVNGSLKLYRGMVSCGTCHDLYADRESKLAMSNHGSRMCLNCHLA